MTDPTKLLSAMKSRLDDTLDRQASDATPPEWGAAWLAFRWGESKREEVMELLPKWAQIQFSQVAELFTAFKAQQQEIRQLTAAVEVAWQEGYRRRMEQESGGNEQNGQWRMGLNNREFLEQCAVFPETLKRLKNIEYQRRLSLERARATWVELF